MTDLIKKYDLYFQARGFINGVPDDLLKPLILAVEQEQKSSYSKSVSDLSDVEMQYLKSSGIELGKPPTSNPIMEAVITFAMIINKSVSSKEAAQRLKIQEIEIKQMLNKKTLYGFCINGQWKIPDYQFVDNALVPYIENVNELISFDQHPISICQWYTLENCDLVKNDMFLSPIFWLKSGLPVERVVKLIPEGWC